MYGSLQELCELEEKSGKPFWKIVQEDDCREQGITEEVSFEQMRAMYQAMKDADARYDEKLKSESGLVGTEGKKMMEARAEGTLLCGDFIGKVMEKALKTSESNACMKRIVAAPTAGSCGVVPAVFLSLQEEKGYSEEKMVEALFVAAGIGGVIACFSGRCSGRLSGRDRFCVCDGSGRSCAFIRRQCKRDRKCSGTGFKKSVGTCL
jgi:L-serine dehydratase